MTHNALGVLLRRFFHRLSYKPFRPKIIVIEHLRFTRLADDGTEVCHQPNWLVGTGGKQAVAGGLEINVSKDIFQIMETRPTEDGH
jgi:hypothetical protein